MNSIIYIFRFLYRIRYWLIVCPLAVATLIFLGTRRMSHSYEVKTTIYTGVVSGYDIESGNSRTDAQTLNNAMDNLVNIISARTTLKNVSLRLYAQDMMFGDPKKDNNYITAAHYRDLYAKTPPDVRKLIDKSSDSVTVANLLAYEKDSPDNFIYGLFNWNHRHYSYEALSKIIVKRLGNSDMLEVRYSADDPGIAYNTLKILNEEFTKQYEELRFGETNNVIRFFEEELKRTAKLLREAEDSLTNYNVEMRVINYDEQTKHVAALSRDFDLRMEDIRLTYNSSGELINQLEERIEEHVKAMKNKGILVNLLKDISDLSTRIATMESFQRDSTEREPASVTALRRQMTQKEQQIASLTDNISMQAYTKEGISTESVVSQWLTELIRHEKSKAELKVMAERKQELDDQYLFFSPIGSTIKRKEREINFQEQSFLSILSSLNTARLRQKNLQMTSATLKIINPPTYPLKSMPTKTRMMVAGGFLGTALFLIGIFFLIDLVDRTLRDKLRTERITGGKVIGASPRNKFKYRAFNKTCEEIAGRYLANTLLNYCKPKGTNIINILSTQSSDGKSYVAEQLAEQWSEMGMKIRLLSWENDFITEEKQFHLAEKLEDLYAPQGEDIIIVEYKNLQEASIPAGLLQEASVNLVVVRANRVWKDTDQLLFDRLEKQTADVPLFLYLTQAERSTVENFTGMLPPYTLLRRLGYRFYQFGLTSTGQ